MNNEYNIDMPRVPRAIDNISCRNWQNSVSGLFEGHYHFYLRVFLCCYGSHAFLRRRIKLGRCWWYVKHPCIDLFFTNHPNENLTLE